MLDDFPKVHGDAREEHIVDIVKNQFERVSFNWYPLTIEYKGNVGKFYVMNDALKIDGVRINATAATQQVIADELGGMLLTAKLSDYIWNNADIRLQPCPRPITSTTQAMIDHSKDVDNQLNGVDTKDKLISTVGKNWIIDNLLLNNRFTDQAINYGWHFVGNSFQGIKGDVNVSLLKNPETHMYWRLIQSRGSHHNAGTEKNLGSGHVDYSQIVRLVFRSCEVDGKNMDLDDVLQNSNLSWLASHEGIINARRIQTIPGLNYVSIN